MKSATTPKNCGLEDTLSCSLDDMDTDIIDGL